MAWVYEEAQQGAQVYQALGLPSTVIGICPCIPLTIIFTTCMIKSAFHTVKGRWENWQKYRVQLFSPSHVLFPCAGDTAQTIIPLDNVFIFFNLFDFLSFPPLHLNVKTEGQIIAWGNSAGSTLTVAAMSSNQILSFQFGPTLNLSGTFIEISPDRLVTDTFFFLFPDCPWLQWEQWVTLIGWTCFLFTPYKGWISLKCNSVLKTYIEEL